ncbi:MAG: HEAT repeat domain-containing protein, partial [Planctomycetota bacterium]|nr:HEAT repeat domain-containing protein [Planctomycetota bacterium]
MNFSHVGPRLISISPILLCGALLFAEGDPKALVRDLIDNIEDPTRGMLLARGSVERVRAAGLPTLPYLVRELSKTKNVQVRLRLLTVVNAVISEAAAASATKKIKLPDEIFQVLDVLVANKDESFVTRYWVTKSFRHVSNEKMVETLSKVLQEDEVKETLQIMAIRAIGTERSGDDILVKYSQSYSFRLREAVCDSLKGAKTKQILGVNFQGLVDPNVLVRQAAIQALIVHTGDPKGYNPHA